MSILLTIGLAILAVIFLVLLSLGLVVALGILLLGGLFLGAAYLIFGHGSLGSVTTMFSGHEKASRLPQEFNHCLLGDDLEKCRKDFTGWTPDQMEIVRQLAKQVRDELGERQEESTQATSYVQNSVNGETTITIDQQTDFDKKEAVREHYLLVNDKETGKLKIKDLKWDY